MQKKAKALRKETGDGRYYAPLDKKETSYKALVQTVVARPFALLFKEPMLLAINAYMSVRMNHALLL